MRSTSTTDDDGIHTIQANSYLTAHVMNRRAWQQEAIAAAEQQWILKEAGLMTRSATWRPSARRWKAFIGNVLIRVGSSLQGAGVPTREHA